MKRFVRIIALVVAMIMFTNTTCTQQVMADKKKHDYNIKVNLGTNCVTIYDGKKPIKAMICSPSNETPTGTFYTPIKYEWHEMIGNCYAQYCTRITGSVLFHSVWYYKKYDKSSMSVSAYNVMGNKASHGCVRLLCKDAKWIYDNCPLKTKVVIFWGDKDDDPIKRPSFTRINTGARTSWDPTDPDPANPLRESKPKIKAKSKKIEYNSGIKAKNAVTITDSLGNTLTKKNATIKIKGKIKTKKLGKYKIKYIVKDSFGNKRVKTITFKVVDTKKPKFTGIKKKVKVAMGTTVNVLDSVKANAVSGANLTSRIKVSAIYLKNNDQVAVNKGLVNFDKPGKYLITYRVKGKNKMTRVKTSVYTVVDKRVKATLSTSKVTIEEGSVFSPYNYISSFTNYKGSALMVNSVNVQVTNNVNTSIPGTYTVKYVFSSAGKEYTKIEKSLVVQVTKKVEEETTLVPEEETTQTPSEEETTTEIPSEEEETSGVAVEDNTNEYPTEAAAV